MALLTWTTDFYATSTILDYILALCQIPSIFVQSCSRYWESNTKYIYNINCQNSFFLQVILQNVNS